MSVDDAIKKFSEKDAKKWAPKKRRKKNGKPEKETERDVMAWLDKHGFSCNVVESKAVFSVSAGRYLKGQTIQGFSDVVGCDPAGRAVFIELKAKGKRSTLRPAQFEFLRKNHSVASLCADSADYVASAYANWLKISVENRPHFLRGLLPTPKSRSAAGRESFDL